MDDLQRVLVTVTGPDSPGITATLSGVVADNHAALLDIEQVVVQGQCILAMLVGVDSARSRGEPVLKDLLFAAKRLHLELQFQVIESPPQGRVSGPPSAHPEQPARTELHRYAVTALGHGLDAAGVHAVSRVLYDRGANLETIRRLSAFGLDAIEIVLSLPGGLGQMGNLRRALVEATQGKDIDVAVQRERVTRRSKRLVAFDMDSTLIQCEVIDELARMHGVVDQVATVTERAMAGELDFAASLRERVAKLEGLSFARAQELAANLPITPGARDMLRVLRVLGYRTAVISGGFTVAATALKEELGLDFAYANKLEVSPDGLLTGRVLEPIVTPERKADLLETIAQQEGIALEQTIAIGDGANDLGMLERAGLGIAFHAKPKLKEAADTSVSAGGLDRILYLLGLSEHDVRELLAE